MVIWPNLTKRTGICVDRPQISRIVPEWFGSLSFLRRGPFVSRDVGVLSNGHHRGTFPTDFFSPRGILSSAGQAGLLFLPLDGFADEGISDSIDCTK